MREHIKWVLAAVEAFVAKFGFCLLVFLAEFKLKAPAFHVFIRPFVDDHLTFLPKSCILVVLNLPLPSLAFAEPVGAFLCLYSSCWRRIQRSIHAVKLQ